MARNPLTTMEYLDCLASYANIDLLFDQGEGDGIPGAVDFDVVIGCHAGTLPAGEDIGIGRQRLQIGSVQRCEQIGAAGTLAAHDAHVQLVQKSSDRDIHLYQGEEPIVPQTCQYPALRHLDGNLDLRVRHWARTNGASMAHSRGLRGRAGRIAVP